MNFPIVIILISQRCFPFMWQRWNIFLYSCRFYTIVHGKSPVGGKIEGLGRGFFLCRGRREGRCLPSSPLLFLPMLHLSHLWLHFSLLPSSSYSLLPGRGKQEAWKKCKLFPHFLIGATIPDLDTTKKTKRRRKGKWKGEEEKSFPRHPSPPVWKYGKVPLTLN